MHRMHVSLACLLSIALISPSPALAARKPAPSRSVQPLGGQLSFSSSSLSQHIARLTIAGVSWGQREATALAKLHEGGFTIIDEGQNHRRSFEEQVARGVMDYPYEIRAEKLNEAVTVSLTVTPDGWRVSNVSYEYTGGLTPRDLERAAIEKYQGLGFRINGQTGWNIVCLPAARYLGELPHIIIQPTSGQFKLVLSGGDRGAEAFKKPFEDAVAKRKGLDQPSF